MKLTPIFTLFLLPMWIYFLAASEETTAAGKSIMDSQLPYKLHRLSTYDENVRVPQPERKMLKIAFYNILTQSLTDSKSNPDEKFLWCNRLKPMTQLILQDRPDVLGFCEAKLSQIRDLKRALASYNYDILGFDRNNSESLEDREAHFETKKNAFSGEFVGIIYRKDRLTLTKSVCHNLEPGEKHKRILVHAEFYDSVTEKHFAVLSSHFDHVSRFSIEKSGEQERSLIEALEEKKMPWFSVGDRNWFFEDKGEEWALQYASHPAICDFRDETEKGHFGPYGTFSGYTWMAPCMKPLIMMNGQKIIQAPTIDVGFRSRKLTRGICSYAYTGEFCPDTYELITSSADSRIEERNFASDHFYIGAIVSFN